MLIVILCNRAASIGRLCRPHVCDAAARYRWSRGGRLVVIPFIVSWWCGGFRWPGNRHDDAPALATLFRRILCRSVSAISERIVLSVLGSRTSRSNLTGPYRLSNCSNGTATAASLSTQTAAVRSYLLSLTVIIIHYF